VRLAREHNRPDLSSALVNLGDIAIEQGNLDEARALMEEALACSEGPTSHPARVALIGLRPPGPSREPIAHGIRIHQLCFDLGGATRAAECDSTLGAFPTRISAMAACRRAMGIRASPISIRRRLRAAARITSARPEERLPRERSSQPEPAFTSARASTRSRPRSCFARKPGTVRSARDTRVANSSSPTTCGWDASCWSGASATRRSDARSVPLARECP
jgi:hypothetical protein